VTINEALHNPDCVQPIDLACLIRRHWQAPQYCLATEIGINPSSLSAQVRAREPLRSETVKKILVALAIAEEARRG